MSKTFHLQIATPDKDFFSGSAISVVLNTTDGELGVLAGHSSMVAAMAPAPIRILTEEGWKVAALNGGFARIKPDYVIIFADTAEWPEDIEEARALEAKRRAEERLRTRQSEIEYVRTRVALEKALARLSVKHHEQR